MKTPKGAVASHDELINELAICERLLADIQPQESELLTRQANLQSKRALLKSGRPAYGQDIAAEVLAIDNELAPLKRRLAVISPEVGTATVRATEIREALQAQIRERAESAVKPALNLCVSAREAYDAEKLKLGTVHAKLDQAKAELVRLEDKSRVQQDSLNPAEEFLRTGRVSPVNEVPAVSQEIAAARKVVEVIEAALGLQEHRVAEARGAYARDLNQGLRAPRESIVRRLATSYGAAVEATQEAAIIDDLAARESDSYGESWCLGGISNDALGCWLNDLRRSGYNV